MTNYNICIYDKKNKTLERFDPHGSRLTNPEIDFELERVINNNMPNTVKKVYGPLDICPLIGFQWVQVSENEIYDKTDPVGFCVAWGMWYVELRLSNPKQTQKQVIEFALEIFKKEGRNLTSFIRNYNAAFVKFRDDYIQKTLTLDKLRKIGAIIITRKNCKYCDYAKNFLIENFIGFVTCDVVKEGEPTTLNYIREKDIKNLFGIRQLPTYPIIMTNNDIIIGGFAELSKLREK